MTQTKRQKKAQITSMLRFAAEFKVKLDCGHSFECSARVVDDEQLFIGKRVACKECNEVADA